MNPAQAKSIMEEARAEVAMELHRAAVEAEKVRIRERMGQPWWKRWFPFRIRIVRNG